MRRPGLVVLLLVLLMLPADAWQRRDPLSSAEIDQLREASQEPPKRLKLYIKFIGDRVAALDRLRTDPRLANERGAHVHDLLQDITWLSDEMNDNIDIYATRKADLRKPLREIVSAETDFESKLRALKQSTTTDPGLASEAKQYNFVLEDALESIHSSLDFARKLFDEQEVEFAKQKKK